MQGGERRGRDDDDVMMNVLLVLVLVLVVVLIRVIVREIRDTDHGRKDLGKEEEGSSEDENEEEGRDWVFEELENGLKDGVEGTCADGESVEGISPHVIPKLLFKERW